MYLSLNQFLLIGSRLVFNLYTDFNLKDKLKCPLSGRVTRHEITFYNVRNVPIRGDLVSNLDDC
jgi:hypothetical protein